MSRTISSNYTSAIALTNQANNPVTVTGTINAASGPALTATGGAASSWTIDNSGTIEAPNGEAALLLGSLFVTVASAVVVNASGGLISSSNYGVYISGFGSLTNAAGGTISSASSDAVYASNGSATIVNSGVIQGRFFGVYLNGAVTNLAGGTISGGDGGGGVWLRGAGTVVNAGVILGTGSDPYAVEFSAITGTNRLVVDPGASFGGAIYAPEGGTNIVELASAASAGTLAGFGTTITNFTSLEFDSGAQWSVRGNDGLTGFGGLTISGFAAHDTIDLTGFAATSKSFSSGALVLTNASSATETLHLTGSFVTSDFNIVTDGSSGTDITACFAAGTRIRTARGDVAVDELVVGDEVASAFGGLRRVEWLGHRRVDCVRHPRPHDVMPVRVMRGAFGGGLPARDLVLSPDHAVYAAEALVPIRYLVNGASIAREEVETITYWHVELPTHDVIFAEDLPAESYLDTGNRGAFWECDGALQMTPDFAREVWSSQACAPLVLDWDALAPLRAQLAEQLCTLGFARASEPDLALVCDGQPWPLRRRADVLSALLPAGSRSVVLRSRCFVPEQVGTGPDGRRLGAAVVSVSLDGCSLPLDDPRFGAGWHGPESGLRWTAGAAELNVAGVDRLDITLAAIGAPYWTAAHHESRLRA